MKGQVTNAGFINKTEVLVKKGMAKFYTLNKQGPSDNIKICTERFLGLDLGSDHDRLQALSLNEWPRVAREWIFRRRPSKWPGTDLVASVVRRGCHLVPTAHDQSKTPDTEWRYSFSVAELALARTLTDVQKQCYIIMKMLYKQLLGRDSRLKSYHLKTVFFRCCEVIPINQWKTDNLSNCILLILENLLVCLTRHNIEHYFIRENNLIDHIQRSDIEIFMNKLLFLITSPVDTLLDFSQNNITRYSFSPFPELQQLVFRKIVSNTMDSWSAIENDGLYQIMTAYLVTGRPWLAMEFVNHLVSPARITYCIRKTQKIMMMGSRLLNQYMDLVIQNTSLPKDAVGYIVSSLAQLYGLYVLAYNPLRSESREELVERTVIAYQIALLLLPYADISVHVWTSFACFLYRIGQYQGVVDICALVLGDLNYRYELKSVFLDTQLYD